MRVKTVGQEARERLVSGGKGYQERQPYREAITSLSGDQLVELEPEPGETLRQMRVRVRRAAKEVGREVQYGETREGTLLVWLAEEVRRRRRRRTADQQPGADLPDPQGEMLP